MPIPPDVLESLKAAHGEVHALSSGEHTVVVRAPRRADYKKFRAKSADERTRPDALEGLTRDVVVWPPPEEFNALLERKPALADVFGAKVLEIAGLVEAAEAKKL